MSPSEDPATSSSTGEYQVVALRYRPQAFSDLVGQGHVAQALSNAIESNRVGHAYLFTGARGVGKTSSARIFAKCLNCKSGPAPEPCNECEICKSVSVGEDVDVLEIDGASNRGIDEIRQLRANAAIRPGRGRFKIYIIDEVHMLTTAAFNALLKTLEEPPTHVKFIFCTTDPQKIPITVLSRCQRYDFSPVQPNEITNRLREIAESEGVKASDEALQLLARRANGSMRDSQSLLEQLFSFCGDDISIDEVHQLLGTTDISRIAEIGAAMTAHDTKTTLNLIHQSVAGGVDAGQLTGQLLGYFRDMMTTHVGCGDEVLQSCSASDVEGLRAVGEQLGLQTILTVIQILDAAVVRMQFSLHSRVLLEAAAVRICNLEHLESISHLIGALSGGPKKLTVAATTSPVKKNAEPVVATEVKPATPAPAPTPAPVAAAPESSNSKPPAPPTAPTTPSSSATAPTTPTPSVPAPAKPASPPPVVAAAGAAIGAAGIVEAATSAPANVENSAGQPTDMVALYRKAIGDMDDMTADMAENFGKIETKAPDHIEVALNDAYSRNLCSRPDRKAKIENALSNVAGRKIRIDFTVSENAANSQPRAPRLSRTQQIRQLQDVGFVKETIDIFGGEVAGFFDPKGPN